MGTDVKTVGVAVVLPPLDARDGAAVQLPPQQARQLPPKRPADAAGKPAG